MARARMYGWSEKRHNGSAKKIAELKGQAGEVRNALDRMTDRQHDAGGTERGKFLATDINAEVVSNGKLQTRQDPERVTLYYLLVFKKRGWVVAAEQPVEVEADEVSDTDDAEVADEVEAEVAEAAE